MTGFCWIETPKHSSVLLRWEYFVGTGIASADFVRELELEVLENRHALLDVSVRPGALVVTEQEYVSS